METGPMKHRIPFYVYFFDCIKCRVQSYENIAFWILDTMYPIIYRILDSIYPISYTLMGRREPLAYFILSQRSFNKMAWTKHSQSSQESTSAEADWQLISSVRWTGWNVVGAEWISIRLGLSLSWQTTFPSPTLY